MSCDFGQILDLSLGRLMADIADMGSDIVH
jgi:hypothetical protein